MTASIFSIALLSIFMSAAAQVSLKRGISADSVLAALHRQNYGEFALAVLSSPWALGGLSLYVLSMMCWIAVLAKAEVSVAYPMVGIGFMLTALIGHFWLGEALGMQKIIGIALIVAGVYSLARAGA